MVQTVEYNGVINNFPDEATPEMIAQALGVKPPSVNSSPSQMTKDQKVKELMDLTGANRTPLDTLKNVAVGLGTAGQNLAEFSRPVIEPLAEKIRPYIPNVLKQLPQTVNMEETFGVTPENRNRLVQGVSEYLPYAIAGGPSFLGQVVAGLTAGTVNTKPEEKNLFGLLPSGRVGGAIESGLLNAGTFGLGKVFEALRPSKFFRGSLKPETLQRNLDITQGTETGLGDVIGSPFLKKRLENTLTSVPFSGANEALQRTGVEVQNRGENILKDLLGDNSPENVPAQISDDLKKVFKAREIEKNNHYKEFNDLADQSNLKLDLPNFSKKANDYSDAINSTNMLKFEPDSAKLFNKLQNYTNPVKISQKVGAIVDESGNPLIDETHFEYPTAKEALLLKGKLNKLSNQAGMSPDPAQRGLSKVFKSLASSLGQDVQNSVNQSKNPELINSLYKAESNYKNNFSPFLDKDIYKFVSGNADPETIVTKFIKTSPNADLAGHLTKLSKNISPLSRDRLAYSYFSRALDNEGNLNPTMLSTAIRKLGSNQLKELVPDANMRKRLLDYTKFEQMNKESLNLMYNPKTGQRAQDALVTGLMAMMGHAIAGDVGGLAGATVPILAGRGMTKYLTSPSVRQSIVQKMIENKDIYTNPTAIRTLQSLLQGNMETQ